MYSIVCSMIFICYNVYQAAIHTADKIETVRTVGLNFSFKNISYDWFFYNIQTTLLLGVFAVCVVIFAIWYGKRLSGVKDKHATDFVYFLLIYSLISPLWLITSVYNTIRQRDAAWR